MYIPSTSKRPPLKEGLPTKPIARCHLMWLFKNLMLGATEICFGDAYASIDEIKTVAEFDERNYHRSD